MRLPNRIRETFESNPSLLRRSQRASSKSVAGEGLALLKSDLCALEQLSIDGIHGDDDRAPGLEQGGARCMSTAPNAGVSRKML